MKKIITIIYLIFIIVNSLSGLILSEYNYINWVSANILILINYFFNIVLINSNSSDGTKIGVSFTNALIFIFTLFLIVKMPNRVVDNYYLIIILILVSIQIFLISSSSIFKKISEKK